MAKKRPHGQRRSVQKAQETDFSLEKSPTPRPSKQKKEFLSRLRSLASELEGFIGAVESNNSTTLPISEERLSDIIEEHLRPVEDHLHLARCKSLPRFGVDRETREWALQQHTEAEIVAGLKDVRGHGGPNLADVIQELEQGLHDSEPSKP